VHALNQPVRPPSPPSSRVALEALGTLARNRASGEFVLAGDDVEAHVFFVEGQVAWATSSNMPNELARRLVERCHLDPEKLRGVVEECRRTGKRFGETLIASGIATLNDVKDALRGQIVAALAALSAVAEPHTSFLPRQVDYRRDLTFALGELLAGSFSAEPHEAENPEEPMSAAHASAMELIRGIAASLPDLLWTQVVIGGDIVAEAARDGALPAYDLAPELDSLVRDEVDCVVIRSAFGALAGQAVPHLGGTLWCAMSSSARLGFAASLMATRSGRTTATAPALETDTAAVAHATETALLLRSTAFLCDLVTNTPQLLAAVVFERDGRGFTSWSRPGSSSERIATAVRGFERVFALNHGDLLPPRTTIEGLLHDRVALAIGHEMGWLYAAALPGRADLACCLHFRRNTPRAFGWVLLDALLRQAGEHVHS